MASYLCPEAPEECDPVDGRGLLSHLHHSHGLSYDDARELRESTDLQTPQTAASDDESDAPREASTDAEEPSDGPHDALADEETDAADSAASTPAASHDHDPSTDGGSDTLSVGHEGSEKLQPEGAPGGSKTNIPAPEGVDADGYTAEDFEHDEDLSDAGHVEDDDNAGDDGDGGLMDRIAGGGSSRSSEEIVEDSDSEEERRRKEELKQRLEEQVEEGGDPTPEPEETGTNGPESTETARTQGGIRVDASMVESVIGMPFNTAAAATGWDGWELTEQEREDNAELLVAVCEEHDVDLSATVLFALSMGGTLSGKAVQYRRHKQREEGEQTPASAADDGRDATPTTTDDDAQRQDASDPVTDGSGSPEYDPEDPSTW
jgi:hypothetical protein